MFWNSDFFLGTVFELKSGKDAVTILHIVNLFLFVGTPEITVAPQPIVCREFNPLANGEILPQSATIGTQFHLRKVGNESVADAVVVKIDFAVVLQLVAQVATERWQAKDDVALFQHVDVRLHGLHIDAYGGSQLRIADLIAHLKSYGLKQGQLTNGKR